MSLSNYRELWSLESCSHFYVILGMALIGKKQLFLFGRGCEVLWHCHFHCRSRQVQLHYFFIYFCLFCSGPFFPPYFVPLMRYVSQNFCRTSTKFSGTGLTFSFVMYAGLLISVLCCCFNICVDKANKVLYA